MRRRELLRGAAAISLAATSPGRAREKSVSRAARARPSDARWPDAAAWAGLGRAVAGRLLEPAPLLAPCRIDAKGAECASLLKSLRNPYFIGDQPLGTQVSGWLDAWTPGRSPYVVAAQTPADVVAAVNFARIHNLRLAIKGGGHSYQGTSNADDSLMIWTRALRAVTVHDAFVPTGGDDLGSGTPAVTLDAGAMWMDAYDAVTTQAGRYVQGGGCATVGVAGLIQSGGFGSFSKRYGLAAASLLQAEIVTADGVLRIVNARRDPDLFWAIKGGGGGSLGVVTRLTLKTHDLPERFGWAGAKIRATSDAAFRRLIDRFVEHYAERLCNPHWGESVEIHADNSLSIGMVNQGLDTATIREVWRPFLEAIQASPDDFHFTEAFDGGAGPARGWWDAQGRRKRGSTAMVFDERPSAPPHHAWWADDQEQVGAFLHGYDSMWLSKALLAPAGRPRLGEALFNASRHMSVALHFNKGLAGAPETALAAARDTATHPGVLDAFALAIIATGGPPAYFDLIGYPPDLGNARRNAAKVAAAAAVLRAVAPGAGSYVSESDYFNADWRAAFWGPHYPRLRAVKAKYDPGGLFIVHHGVGSEDWSADGFTPLT